MFLHSCFNGLCCSSIRCFLAVGDRRNISHTQLCHWVLSVVEVLRVCERTAIRGFKNYYMEWRWMPLMVTLVMQPRRR